MPPILAASGMTLYASPADMRVTDTTEEPKGEVSRDTSVCSRQPSPEQAAQTISQSCTAFDTPHLWIHVSKSKRGAGQMAAGVAYGECSAWERAW